MPLPPNTQVVPVRYEDNVSDSQHTLLIVFQVSVGDSIPILLDATFTDGEINADPMVNLSKAWDKVKADAENKLTKTVRIGTFLGKPWTPSPEKTKQ